MFLLQGGSWLAPRLHSGRAGIAAGRARLPAGPLVEAAGMRIGGDGGGRDLDWQRG